MNAMSAWSDKLFPTIDCETNLLTKGDLQSVTVGVTKKGPIAHGGATVFRFTNKTALHSGDLAQPVDLLARSHADAKVSKRQQRKDFPGRLHEHDDERPGSIADPRHAGTPVNDVHIREPLVELDTCGERADG